MHYTTQRFWECYNALPEAVQRVADQNYELLKTDPSHPSLHPIHHYILKKLGNTGR